MDIIEQVVSMSVEVCLQWFDERITFYNFDMSRATSNHDLLVENSMIWLPHVKVSIII